MGGRLLAASLGLVVAAAMLGVSATAPLPVRAACGLGFIDVTVREAITGRPVPGAVVSLDATPLRAGPLAGSTWRFSGLDTCGGFGGTNEYRVRVTAPAGWIPAGDASLTVRLTPAARADFLLTDGESLTPLLDRHYGAVLASNSPNISRFTGGSGRQGAVVFFAPAGCPFDLAGLGAGDVIVAVDGRPIGGWLEFDAQFATTTGPIAADVVRKGRSDVQRAQIMPVGDTASCDWSQLDTPAAQLPDDPILLMAKAFDSSDPAAAAALFRRVTAIAPGFGQPWGELSIAAIDPLEARQLLDRALALDPDLVEFRAGLCTDFADVDWDRYTACAEDNLRRNAASGVSNNNAAWGLAHLRRELPRAQQLAERAVSLVPTRSDNWDTLGYVYLVRGDRPSAIVAYRQAVTVCGSPDDCAARERALRTVESGGTP